MPPNITSLIQPLDQGIIRAAKAHYRTQIMRKMLQEMEQSGTSKVESSKSVDILRAMHMLKRAWFLVMPTTIKNCFRKAKFPITHGDDNEEEVAESVTAHEFGATLTDEDFQIFIDCD